MKRKKHTPEQIRRTVTALREELAKIDTLPETLGASLAALEKDHEFMLRGDVFTEDFVHTWIEYKREVEVDGVRLRPHPHEFELYYDC